MPTPRWIKDIPLTWPVVVTALGIVVTAASANTRLDDLATKVEYLYTEGSPAVSPRLARMDEREQQMQKTLDRVDQKLDRMEDREAADGR